MSNKQNFTTIILWCVYGSLLLVLLPHTAWAFRNWEPEEAIVIYGEFTSANLVSYVAAFAFEAAIAVLTHKLAKHIEETPKGKRGWARFSYRYLNPISIGLIVSTIVSALANLAHAVEYGRTLKIFADWGIPSVLYSLAFGGVLPLVSLTFARVLSNVVEDEEAPNPELMQANEQIKNLRSQLRESESKAKAAEERARIAEDRFGAMGDLVKHLFGEDKRQRIIITRKQWPQLPGAAIAIITEASPAYVSEVLKDVQV